MNRSTFIILVAIVAAMSAIVLSNRANFDEPETTRLLPKLGDALNDITSLTIKAAGNRTVATLARGAERWTVAERGGYAADIGKIRDNLIALANATVVEEKTTDPALYHRLGVEDIAGEDATGVEIIIEGPGGPYRIIVGQTGVRGDHAYARKPGTAVSLLIAARLDIGTTPTDWLDRTIIDIPSGEIFRVTTTHPDGEVIRIEKAGPEDSGFELADQPPDTELAYTGVTNPIGAALANLSLDDVKTRAAVNLSDTQPIVTRFETVYGLIISVSIHAHDDGDIVALDFSADPALAERFAAEDQDAAVATQAEARASDLNERLSEWVFEIPGYKRDNLTRRMSDLLN